MIVTEVVVELEQPFPSVKAYVTVYVPAVLVARLTNPEPAVMLSPEVEEKVPPVVPVKVTAAVPVAQYGLPA